jgi:hypothetical protein
MIILKNTLGFVTLIAVLPVLSLSGCSSNLAPKILSTVGPEHPERPPPHPKGWLVVISNTEEVSNGDRPFNIRSELFIANIESIPGREN